VKARPPAVIAASGRGEGRSSSPRRNSAGSAKSTPNTAASTPSAAGKKPDPIRRSVPKL
jgi:hypothetical protein